MSSAIAASVGAAIARAAGGLLVVDDMRRPNVNIVADQALKTERVRSALLSDPRLVAAELDWASGVILAPRIR